MPKHKLKYSDEFEPGKEYAGEFFALLCFTIVAFIFIAKFC